MKLIIAITLIFTVARSFSQSVLKVLDQETKEPVSSVLVVVRNNQGEEFGVTDESGHFNFSLNLPVQYQVSHVSYSNLNGKLLTTESVISLAPEATYLNDVVVTGQFEPQSIDQSVHTVKAIHREQIEAQGAIDLADVLSNNLNITLTPSKSEGRTSISMLGLDGQYVKVLIDGIPVPSINGNGNNVDISQINMNSIERVEIVEGPMAVSYGANALAGVVNLITKQSTYNSVSIQEETVGPEYGWDKGRHIQTINLGKDLGEKWSIQGEFQRNDFRGFFNGFEGKDHTENDDLRGHDWLPKLQYATSAFATYKGKRFRGRYRVNYFGQKLDRHSRVVFPDEHISSGIENPFALDLRNETRRYGHYLDFSGQLGHDNPIGYSVVSAFTKVRARQYNYRYRIQTEQEEEITNEEISFLESFTSRGNVTNILGSQPFDLELGYEYTHESVDGAQIDEGQQSIDNIAGFANLEWTPISKLTLRPGFRTFYNSLYASPLIYSINAKYNAPANFDIRFSAGRSYRTPNITELYFWFVDANHDVRGNPELRPEDGYGLSLDIKKRIKTGNLLASSSLKLFYNNLSDQIMLAVVNEAPLQFQYINIERFKSKGLSFNNQLEWPKIAINVGASYIGRFNQFFEDDNSLDDFLFSPELNFNTIYKLKPNLSLALYYKHTGRVEQYIQEDEEFRKGVTESFNWLDLTSTWRFNNHFEFRGGVKNLMNITDVQTTTGQAGVHSAAATTTALAYGRSYFLRATYKF